MTQTESIEIVYPAPEHIPSSPDEAYLESLEEIVW